MATQDGIAGRDLPPRGMQLVHRLHEAKSAFDTLQDGPDAPYTDCHAWFFTPASFERFLQAFRLHVRIEDATEAELEA